MTERELLPLPEVAVAIKASWHKAYNLLTAGELGEPVRRDNHWYAQRKAVRAYIERQREGATA